MRLSGFRKAKVASSYLPKGELKHEAAAVLKASGLDPSTAIRLFQRSVVEKGGLPRVLPRANNPTTLAAIREVKAGKATRTALHDVCA